MTDDALVFVRSHHRAGRINRCKLNRRYGFR